MDVVSLSSTNYSGLTSRYSSDEALKFNQNIYYTEEGLEIPLIQVFSKLNDSAINNYSNLFLTTRQAISGTIYLQNLQPLTDNGFSSYIATNAEFGITENSRFLTIEEPPIDRITAAIAMTGTYEFLNNENMFDIELISDKLCKISHENENIIRYLTYDYTGRLIFAKDSKTDYAGDLSPQIFYYMYDRIHNFIIFLKNVNDIVKYVAYDPDTEHLSLIDPLTAADVPYKNAAIITTIPRMDIPNNTSLYDPWVSYNKNLKTNSQDIDISRSVLDAGSNMLINSEFYSITGTDMPVNILSLKNSNTPENYQARANPFQFERSTVFAEKSVELRDYKKIFSGSNQKFGNDNISLGYESYTTDIVLQKDKITYFHIPQDFYPYLQLNINDSGLVDSGAIAGDHPLKSDKIFKKHAHFRNTSTFGDTIEEADGYFLCSWLSGNWDVNVKPVWMDRYYNPSQISFLAALSTNPFKAIIYTSVSNCLFSEVTKILGQVDVFDKTSDMIFEPETYYAYHHQGPGDVSKLISSLEPFLVQQDFAVYNDVYDRLVIPLNAAPTDGVYRFNNNHYAATGSLSAIQESSEFTLSFWGHTTDWNTPFGTQILGNYVNDGFGIFNENVVTPTLYVNSGSGLYILNTDLQKVKEVYFGKEIGAIIKYDNVTDYYVIFSDGNVIRYNSSDAPVRSVFDSNFINVINYDYTAESTYALCSATQDIQSVLEMATPSMGITDITSIVTDYSTNSGVFAFDQVANWIPSQQSKYTMLNKSCSIDQYDGNLYFTPGTITRRVGDKIYYLKSGNTIVRWDNINQTTQSPVVTAFKSYTGIADFSIDFEDNIWVIDTNNTFFKYTSDRQFILSGYTSNPNFTNFKIGFIADFYNGIYSEQALLMQKGSILLSPDPNKTYTYNIIDEETQDTIEGLVADTLYPVSGSGILFNLIDKNTGIVTSGTSFLGITGTHFDPTLTPYLRKFIKVLYPKANMNIKTTMVNRFNPFETRTVNIPFNLSALDMGYHHFAVRVDTYGGFIAFFIDGRKVADSQFEPRRFQFDNFSRRPFLAGTANFINSVPLFKYLNKIDGLTNDFQIKNLRIYNSALNDTEISILSRENMEIHDIHFNVPCGRRNYVEEIERYFKARTPGAKSTLFNIVIKNAGITDVTLRQELEQILLQKISTLAPAYTKINTIKWVN
jgi:hypothetical protein